DARILEAAGDLEHRQLRLLGPALHRDLPVARIEPDRNALGMLLGGFPHERRIAHRGSADDDAIDPLLEPAVDRLHVPHAAPELPAQPDGLEAPLDRRAVHRLAGKRAVEIDDMQMTEALRLERERLLRRIAVEDGRARHVALLEAHRKAL